MPEDQRITDNTSLAEMKRMYASMPSTFERLAPHNPHRSQLHIDEAADAAVVRFYQTEDDFIF